MEEALVSVIEKLLQSQWKHDGDDLGDFADFGGLMASNDGTKHDLSLLHLAASLGYTR